MAGVQPPPLRSLDDFLLCSARFAVPDVRDLDRWNHRMINNLLYYQTNYLLSALVLLLIVGYFQPFQMFVGVTVVSVAFVGFVFAAENQATVRRFRRNHPYVSVTAVLLATYLFMLALGGVAVFLFGIAFPVLSKSGTLESTLITNPRSGTYVPSVVFFCIILLEIQEEIVATKPWILLYQIP
uniref:PRA1 family protein n=1 Tax=Oryzias sinensis TaxID=183150 RepID=A0A8C7WT01_9TELE